MWPLVMERIQEATSGYTDRNALLTATDITTLHYDNLHY